MLDLLSPSSMAASNELTTMKSFPATERCMMSESITESTPLDYQADKVLETY